MLSSDPERQKNGRGKNDSSCMRNLIHPPSVIYRARQAEYFTPILRGQYLGASTPGIKERHGCGGFGAEGPNQSEVRGGVLQLPALTLFSLCWQIICYAIYITHRPPELRTPPTLMTAESPLGYPSWEEYLGMVYLENQEGRGKVDDATCSWRMKIIVFFCFRFVLLFFLCGNQVANGEQI